MATPVTLPELGESVTEGTVTRWLKSVGDEVAVDEPLLEVSTDKVDTEIPSPIAGTLLEIKVDEDETVEVGAELAMIGDSAEGGSDGGSADGGAEDGAEDGAASDAQPEDDADSGDSGDAGEGSGLEQEAEQRGTEREQAAQEVDQTQQVDDEPEQESEPTPSGGSSAGGSSSGSGDSSPVTLPELGESVTEGTVTRWLKSVGDEVAVDEPLLEVSTDKVDTEIPSPVAGTLLEIKVQEDETVAVGAELALVGSGQPSAPDTGTGTGTDDTSSEDTSTEDTSSEDTSSEDTSSGDEAQGTPEPEPEGRQESTREPEIPPATEPGGGAKAAPQAHTRDTEPAQSKQATEDTARGDNLQQQSASPERGDGASSDGASSDGGAYVTPLVRKLAAEHGVELSNVEGTGVGGRIRKQDVLDAARSAKASAPAAPPAAEATAPSSGAPAAPKQEEPSPLRGRTEPLSRLRKVIAKRMVESLQTSAQLTTVVEVDVTSVSRLRDSVKADFAAREGVKLSFMPFFVKAAIDALKVHPSLNAAIDTEKGEVTYYDHENIAIAVDTEKGLLTPVIKNAGDLNVAGLARHIADLAQRTRANKIGPDELAGGTFTLTNTGSRGALFDTPIINQPQVAILGTGSVVKRAVVIDDANLGETIAVRQMCYLALTYDHRLVDGADAARFLSDVKQRLETGQFEV